MQTVIEEPTLRPSACAGASKTGVPEPLVTIAARVAALCAERAQTLDTSGGFPVENYDAIKSSDLLHMALPTEFGGRNASMLDVAQVLHVLAKGCPSTALIFNMHLAVTGQLTHMWSLDPAGPWGAWLRRIAEGGMLLGGALSESSSWNGVIFPQAQASVVKGGYSITGSRSFCTGSSHLNLVQCTATVMDEASGRRRCIYFLFDPSSPGVTMKNDWDTMGMRGSHSQGLTLDGLLVPREDVLYEYAYGALDLSQLWLSFLAWSFIGFASVYSGAAESARDQVLRIILDRKRVPGTHGLVHKSSNQVHMAQLDVLNATMTAIREDTARRYPQGTSITVKTIIDTAVAKQVCVTSAPRAVEHAMAIVGGQSYFRKLPLERLFRDVSAGPFHPFSVDDTLEMLGKFAFGVPFLEPGGWAL